jgi:thioredoxin-like negative regulator of GroEL
MIEVIKFGAVWCNPCKLMATTMDLLRVKYNIEGSDILVSEIDVDLNPEMAQEHKIKNIPTTIFLVDGKVSKKIAGVLTYDQIENIINNDIKEEK